jgi:hypothetical protein
VPTVTMASCSAVSPPVLVVGATMVTRELPAMAGGVTHAAGLGATGDNWAYDQRCENESGRTRIMPASLQARCTS